MGSKGIVKLQGKDYKTVALRMGEFRERFSISEGWAVVTTIHAITDSAILFRAEIRDPEGRVVGTGHASGTRKGSKALEKCETTAVGRALAAIGLTGEEYASADEIKAWMEDRDNPTPPPVVEEPEPEPRWSDSDRKWFCGKLSGMGLDYDTVAAFTEAEGWGRPSGWERKRLGGFLEKIPAGDIRDRYDSFANVGS